MKRNRHQNRERGCRRIQQQAQVSQGQPGCRCRGHDRYPVPGCGTAAAITNLVASSDIWMDFTRQYTDRVEKMSGGRLKIDLPEGVPGDGRGQRHAAGASRCTGTARRASLFGTSPVFGGSATTMPWFNAGGRELYAN